MKNNLQHVARGGSTPSPYFKRARGPGLASRSLVFSGALLLTVSACGTATVNQAQDIATSGVALSGAMPAVYDASFASDVTEQGQILAFTRAGIATRDARRKNFDSARTALEDQKVTLNALRRHSALLRQYFSTLDAVARTGEPKKFADATAGIITGLQAISPDLKTQTIGNAPIGDLIPAVVELSVNAAIAAKLGARLRTDHPVILSELALQKAALDLLAEDLAAQSALARQLSVRSEVREPYAGDASLPKDWQAKWSAAFVEPPAVEAVALAARAMDDLRKNYADLVEGRASIDSTQHLLEDIGRVLGLIETVKGT